LNTFWQGAAHGTVPRLWAGWVLLADDSQGSYRDFTILLCYIGDHSKTDWAYIADDVAEMRMVLID
jgi:hypothetical protein